MNLPPVSLVSIVMLLTAWLLVMPAGAALALSGITMQPDIVPLVPRTGENVMATFAVTPYGATTFPSGHALQIETGLSNASWDTWIIVDGRAAAEQQASGPVAFINGYILSYGTGTDVALTVNISGSVPDVPGQVILLSLRELDNSGVTVPGSQITISRPVVLQAGTTRQGMTEKPSPFPSPATAGTTPPVTTTAGGCPAVAIPATCAAVLLVSLLNLKRT